MIQYRLLHWDSILDQIQILIFNRTISLSGKTAFFFFLILEEKLGKVQTFLQEPVIQFRLLYGDSI